MGVQKRSRGWRRIDVSAAACAFAFVGILGLAAYWDRSIRLLHLFESLPYLIAAVLCLRQSKFGYALGAASGAFFLWTGGLLTTFVRNGFERVGMLLRTGSVDRPDVLIAAPAAVATAGLVVCAVAGYLRLPNKSWRDLGVALPVIVAVPAFFILLFATLSPQYLGMFHGILKWFSTATWVR
jgi:hypothetical protein